MNVMRRRDFLAAVATGISASGLSFGDPQPSVETVSGPLRLNELGLTLMHEHVMVDFVGADRITPDRYRSEEVYEVALPPLKRAYRLGCRTVVECTPAYLGRDPLLLRRLSKASGLHIVTNTGFYAAVGGKFLPAAAFREDAGEIADRWISESRHGIGGSGVKPGFIKIGVDTNPLPESARKLARAAAITHRETGLTIASHAGNGGAAIEQLDILQNEGVSAAAFIWVHAQSESTADLLFKAAAGGAWVEFDGINESSLERHVELVRAMIERGHLKQTLISMDAGWYHVGEPGGGKFRGYEVLFESFLPALRRAGVSEMQIRSLLVDNPRRALQPERRLL